MKFLSFFHLRSCFHFSESIYSNLSPLSGAALGWPSPSGVKLVAGDDRYFPIDQRSFDWVASVLMLGCAVSCIPIGALASKFGRKWTMLGLTVPCVVGWLLVIWARNLTMLLIGRFLLGLAGGAFHVAAPQYSSEIAEKEIRGTLGSFCIVNMNAGILFSYILGAYVSVYWTSFISGVIPLVFALIFAFMPESPHFLVMKNREDEAKKTLKWLRGSSYDPSWEINELKHEFEENAKNKATLMEILERPATKRALFIGFGLMFFQQACGINAVIFYSTFIFTVRPF